MNAGKVDQQSCQYHLSDGVRDKLSKSKDLHYGKTFTALYNWSESWFHISGPVREVNTIAAKALRQGKVTSNTTHYKESTKDTHWFIRGLKGLGWGAVELVLFPVTLGALAIRAYGRNCLIQHPDSEESFTDDLTNFINESDIESLTEEHFNDFLNLNNKSLKDLDDTSMNNLLNRLDSVEGLAKFDKLFPYKNIDPTKKPITFINRTLKLPPKERDTTIEALNINQFTSLAKNAPNEFKQLLEFESSRNSLVNLFKIQTNLNSKNILLIAPHLSAQEKQTIFDHHFMDGNILKTEKLKGCLKSNKTFLKDLDVTLPSIREIVDEKDMPDYLSGKQIKAYCLENLKDSGTLPFDLLRFHPNILNEIQLTPKEALETLPKDMLEENAVKILETFWGKLGLLGQEEMVVDSTALEDAIDYLLENKLNTVAAKFLSYSQVISSLDPAFIESELNGKRLSNEQKAGIKNILWVNIHTLMQRGASSNLLISLIPENVKTAQSFVKIMNNAYKYGAAKEFKTYCRNTLAKKSGNLLIAWANSSILKLHEGCIKDLLDEATEDELSSFRASVVSFEKDKLRAFIKAGLFSDEVIREILAGEDGLIKTNLIKYCCDIKPSITKHVIDNELFDLVEVTLPPYRLTAEKLEKIVGNDLFASINEMVKKGTIKELDDHTFVILDPTKLSDKWKKLFGKIQKASKAGGYSTFDKAPAFRKDGSDIVISQEAIKRTNNASEKGKLTEIGKKLENAELKYVEELGEIIDEGAGLTRVVKLFRGGDAGSLPPLDHNNTEDVKERANIFLDACKGTKQLRDLGFYQVDFKRSNIFIQRDDSGRLVKAVVGDLGGLLYLPETFDINEIENTNGSYKSEGIAHSEEYVSPNFYTFEQNFRSIDSSTRNDAYNKIRSEAEKEVLFQMGTTAIRMFQGTKDPMLLQLIKDMQNPWKSNITLDKVVDRMQQYHDGI